MSKEKIPDEEMYVNNWQSLLKELKSIDLTKSNARKELEKMKEKTLTTTLTQRQLEGIRGRIDYAYELLDNPPKERKHELNGYQKDRQASKNKS